MNIKYSEKIKFYQLIKPNADGEGWMLIKKTAYVSSALDFRKSH
jgi:hypothetical protein